MVESFEITDPGNLPVTYAGEMFNAGDRFEFSKGTNVIIGGNGSGKSTLLNLMKSYLLCRDSMESDGRKFRNLFHPYDPEMYSGGALRSDYRLTAFNLRMSDELTEDDRTKDFDSFGRAYMDMHSSTGEKTLRAVETLFRRMFRPSEMNVFPEMDIRNGIGTEYDGIGKKAGTYLKYVDDNRTGFDMENPVHTVFMDEPDRNLSIDNLKQIYGILSAGRPDTQIIAVIHEPLLINALSKLDGVNIMEMSKGYLSKVKDFVRKFR